MKKTFSAVKLVLASRKHFLTLLFFSFVMFSLTFFFPVFAIPGNTLELQISLTTFDSLFLSIVFSSLFGLSIAMHNYASSLKKRFAIANNASSGFVGFTATLFSLKLCPVCLTSIFSLIGLSGAIPLFLFSHRTIILIASLILLSASVMIAGRSILVCEKCEVKK